MIGRSTFASVARKRSEIIADLSPIAPHPLLDSQPNVMWVWASDGSIFEVPPHNRWKFLVSWLTSLHPVFTPLVLPTATTGAEVKATESRRYIVGSVPSLLV